MNLYYDYVYAWVRACSCAHLSDSYTARYMYECACVFMYGGRMRDVSQEHLS